MLDARPLNETELKTLNRLRSKYGKTRTLKTNHIERLTVAYDCQGNFTTAILLQPRGVRAVGVAKRNMEDSYDAEQGRSRAFGRAALRAIGIERAWATNGHSHGDDR